MIIKGKINRREAIRTALTGSLGAAAVVESVGATTSQPGVAPPESKYL